MKNTSATENASEDDTNVLPELTASLFNPCSINYLEAELKESSYKSLTDCFYENSQIIFDHLTQVSHWHNFKQELTLTSLGWELDNESRSFAEKIMDYKKLLSGAATSYGTKNRNKAREECKKEILKYHHNLEIKPTGLHANEKFSELGGSSDGLIYFGCHGIGILEIQCLLHKFKKDFKKCESHKSFQLDLNNSIKINHEYYHQV